MIQTASMVLRSGTKLLTASIGDGAARDARILMAHILDISPSRLPIALSRVLTPQQVAQFEHTIHCRAAHTPISHITGKRAFWKYDFCVTPDVLDPRPETETLIELALQGPEPATILDLGTGSGCILLSLLSELPQAMGIGVDISEAALKIASENIDGLDLTGRATLQISDWFSEVNGQFDLIVSNPPYITEAEMLELEPAVCNHEPHLALTTGGDGLSAYRNLAKDLKNYLTPGGRAFFEIGKDQGQKVYNIFANTGIGPVVIHPDLGGHPRIVSVNV
ncbi:MAG: peptide chain release factor N(5)-glutamine methyltransferase [Amylibacter sp.]|nr:peptide chain release factor N(5)-glutamine methyltransferase [Amylibacter sp.]